MHTGGDIGIHSYHDKTTGEFSVCLMFPASKVTLDYLEHGLV